MRLRRLIFTIPFLCIPALAAAEPTPVGLWKSIDDATHKPRAFIRLYEQAGEIFGRVESSVDPNDPTEFCTRCDGDRKNKPVIGMVILRHMKKHGAEYSGGDILDPDSGWVYRCRLWLQDGGASLVVRGFLGISLAGRSQTWLRVE